MTMTSPSLAALLQPFFTDRLVRERSASPHTVAGYRDSFRLLLRFAGRQLGKAPSDLEVADLDAAYLTRPETEALLAAPELSTWIGRRDRALLLLAVQTGLRVSELIGLRCQDVVLGTGAHVRCEGKGRKERLTPLRKDAAAVIDAWLRELRGRTTDPASPACAAAP